MTHREKVDYFIADMKKRGVGEYTAAPPLYRLLWFMGMKIPPPHFQGFVALALGTGIPFGLFMGVAMSLWAYLMYRGKGLSLEFALLTGLPIFLLGGALFGLTMAAYFRWSARRLNLPSWDQYPASALASASDRDNQRKVE